MEIVIFLLAVIGFLVVGIILFVMGRMYLVTRRSYRLARTYSKRMVTPELIVHNAPEPTINENGTFVKAEEFERIWKKHNIHHKFGADKELSDEDYIDYHIWEDQHDKEMWERHSPQTKVIRGENPNLIFHGGCLGCASQRIHGIERCMGCMYFKADWNKPDLSIEGEESATFKF